MCFAGDSNLYTICMFDISIDVRSGFHRSILGRPYAHWVQTNIQGLDLTTGKNL